MENLQGKIFRAVVADVIGDNPGASKNDLVDKLHRRFSGLDAKTLVISGLKPGVEPTVEIIPN